jgi:hypothetical protein
MEWERARRAVSSFFKIRKAFTMTDRREYAVRDL